MGKRETQDAIDQYTSMMVARTVEGLKVAFPNVDTSEFIASVINAAAAQMFIAGVDSGVKQLEKTLLSQEAIDAAIAASGVKEGLQEALDSLDDAVDSSIGAAIVTTPIPQQDSEMVKAFDDAFGKVPAESKRKGKRG